jgi:diguanylate cyclase (GGDEF)-like protein/PAS domain S-box-containing protein
MVMSSSTEVCAVLLVEDDEDDFLITSDMLAGQERVMFLVDWAPTYEQALESIRQQRHDVYIIDYRLGSRTGLELVREGFAERPRAPVIVLTGQVDLTVDLEASALGVTDFLVKRELDPAGLERSIRYAVSHHKALHDLARSEERYALAVRAANDGIWDWDLSSGHIYYAPRWYSILGLVDSPVEEHPERWLSLVHEDDVPRVRAAIDDHLAGHTEYLQVEHRMRHADGTLRWVLNRGLAIRDESGVATRMAGSMADITDQRLAEHKLQHDALHDALTELPNRALFMDRLQQLLQRTLREPGTGCAVLFLDIDRFKLVNDSFSHAVGDQLLVAMSRRIAGVVRPGDTIARLGGDEFTVLLDGVVTEQEATVIAGRIQGALTSPILVGDVDMFVSASIGVALTTPGMTAEDLLRNADIAMYDAKHRGRGRFAVFDESMHQRVVDRMARENELRQVIEQELLEIHYQPIVDLATGRIRFLEALARWPKGWPYVSPEVFVPIAEETGMIGALGLQVLRGALGALARWRRAGLVAPDTCISVNVSARQLDDPDLPGAVLAAIAAAGVPADVLRLEITESMLIHEAERIQRIVSDVCATGVGLHLDDYGTGYSSLAALHQFPVDALKIDRSFINSLYTSDGGSEVIVRSTVALAHGLGLHVIGEGVEAPRQAGTLRALGCDFGQGYLFARPLPPEELEPVLASWSPDAAVAHCQAAA